MTTAHPSRFITAAAVTLALVLVLVLMPGAVRAYATHMFGALREPGEPAFIAAHRGDRAVAPENTIPAFEAAFERGYDFVECDVQLTADGHAVVLHDETVDRTTDGSGRVDELALAEIATLDAGSWFDPEFAGTPVPTLDDFLALLARSDSRALVELKQDWTADDVEAIRADIYRHGVQDRIVFASFSLVTLAALEEAEPVIPRVLLQRRLTLDPVALAGVYGAIAVMTNPDALEARPDAVARLHEAGLGVLLYTLNSEERWSDALDLGVDGIATDTPSDLDDWIAHTAPGT